MSKKQKESGIAAIIDEDIVCGCLVKEWSIKQFTLLYPSLKTVMSNLKAEGATLDSIESYLGDNFMSLVDHFVPVITDILEVSLLGQRTKEQVEAMSASEGTIVGFAILKKNLEHLASFLAQLQRPLGEQDLNQTTT